MLFTDREFITVSDLQGFEPEITTKVLTPAIPVTGDNNILQRSISDCAVRLMASCQQFESYPSNGDGLVSPNHLAGVFSNVYGTRNVPRVRLNQICLNSATPGLTSALKLWVCNYTLEQIFKAAWNRKVRHDKYEMEDKWQEKQKEYAVYARTSFSRLRAEGLPVVWRPLSAPAAAYDWQPGTWGDANLAATSGAGTEAGGEMSVQVSYVDQTAYLSRSKRGNAESHPSMPATLTVASGEVLVVDISSLNPPDGAAPPTGSAQGLAIGRKATGWNLYVNGVLQNAVPIPIATKTYTLAADPEVSADPWRRIGEGQYPDIFSVMPQLVYRG